MDIIKIISKNIPNLINHIIYNEKTKQIIVRINQNNIKLLFTFLKKFSLIQMQQLQDLYGTDFLNTLRKAVYRFQINYILLSISKKFRLYLKFNIKDNNFIESITEIYKSSNWLERELWDLYGILIKNHPDLRRILTDYGFQGYALRKDFPLSGYIEILYDIEYKMLAFNSIELLQEYRAFEFTNPWSSNLLTNSKVNE